MIESVVGIVCSQKGVLLGLRKSGGAIGGLWEFPGGKCEKGETHAEALIREYDEELAVTVTVGDFIAEKVFPRRSDTLHLFAYEVSFLDEKAEPMCNEHQQLEWVNLSEIDNKTLVPSDALFLDEVKTFYEKKYSQS